MNTNIREKILYKELSYIIQGCCFEIRKEYGAGQKETVYVNLLKEYLESKGLKVEKEKSIKIYSSKTGKIVGSYRPDLIVEDKIPIEVKSSSFTTKQDEKQLYHYLRNSNYELGYLVNFSTRKLFMKRIIYTNDKKPFLKLLSCIFAFCFVLFSVNTVNATILNLVSQTKEIGITQQFEVNVILNTEGEQINAIEGKIVFPEDLLEVKEIRDGNSIINFWIERPKAETLKDANTNTNLHRTVRVDSCGEANNSCGFVYFSGITPGGYNGNQGLILSIIFLAKKEGSGLIEIQNAKTLLNDGNGTEAQLKIFNFQFSIFKESPISQTPILEIQDTEPPEDFQPEISRDPAIFDGKWFLVFTTQDKASGVDYYAIHESTRKRTRINTKDWIQAESPYLLKDQKLQSYIYVKAIDKAGNERIIIVPPRNPLKWYEKFENWVIIILLAVLVFYILRKILWKIYTKQH
jgi:GxxExxY protein